jgi:hypothetical protein
MEKKRECYRESAGDSFIPYMTIFFYWGEDREAAEVALSPYYFVKNTHVCAAHVFILLVALNDSH